MSASLRLMGAEAAMLLLSLYCRQGPFVLLARVSACPSGGRATSCDSFYSLVRIRLFLPSSLGVETHTQLLATIFHANRGAKF